MVQSNSARFYFVSINVKIQLTMNAHLALNVFGDHAFPGTVDGMSKNVIVIMVQLQVGVGRYMGTVMKKLYIYLIQPIHLQPC